MDKLAIVFPGQGAQYAGMGRSLYEGSEAARAVLDRLEAVRPGTLEQCFSGSEEELKDTANTQPCIFAVSLAAAAALEAMGARPSALAGFSLGELTALTAGGVFSPEDGFRLVTRRGSLMAEAANTRPGAMVAVMKLSAERVEELAGGFDGVYPVNYNCPGQTVVAGDAGALEPFKVAVKAAGGRALPLKVGGGFHSPFMAEASAAFSGILTTYTAESPSCDIYANLTARPYEGDVADMLARQMVSPVRWQETVENLAASGITAVVEAGPGSTLCGLVKKCTDKITTYHVEDLDSLTETGKGLGLC